MTPASLGVTVVTDVTIADLVQFIDWSPFFQVRSRSGAAYEPRLRGQRGLSRRQF